MLSSSVKQRHINVLRIHAMITMGKFHFITEISIMSFCPFEAISIQMHKRCSLKFFFYVKVIATFDDVQHPQKRLS